MNTITFEQNWFLTKPEIAIKTSFLDLKLKEVNHLLVEIIKGLYKKTFIYHFINILTLPVK